MGGPACCGRRGAHKLMHVSRRPQPAGTPVEAQRAPERQRGASSAPLPHPCAERLGGGRGFAAAHEVHWQAPQKKKCMHRPAVARLGPPRAGQHPPPLGWPAAHPTPGGLAAPLPTGARGAASPRRHHPPGAMQFSSIPPPHLSDTADNVHAAAAGRHRQLGPQGGSPPGVMAAAAAGPSSQLPPPPRKEDKHP